MGSSWKRRLRSRTARARLVVLGSMLLVATWGWHPFGAALSGAFDKALFDLGTSLSGRDGSRRVAVVLHNPAVPHHNTARLLDHLRGAASVTFDDVPHEAEEREQWGE